MEDKEKGVSALIRGREYDLGVGWYNGVIRKKTEAETAEIKELNDEIALSYTDLMNGTDVEEARETVRTNLKRIQELNDIKTEKTKDEKDAKKPVNKAKNTLYKKADRLLDLKPRKTVTKEDTKIVEKKAKEKKSTKTEKKE